MKREKDIKVFYTPKQVLVEKIRSSTSKSPLKPMLLMRVLESMGIGKHLSINEAFRPFDKSDFFIAHSEEYVHEFFAGTGRCSSNSIPWSRELTDTVRYTNSSLYHAIKHSLLNPTQVCFSPTSGFHHAQPENGSGFCTFAGQVIAAIKLYNEFGVSGAVFDLDGHFGNSIEDGRENSNVHSANILNKAIPLGFNINPVGKNQNYLEDLKRHLERVELFILADKIHYIMWCHGADSHSSDDLGGQVNTEYWVKCSEVFYDWIKKLDAKLDVLNRMPIPLTLSLFGGYRRDHYASVLSLHTKDIVTCLNTLCLDKDSQIKYEAKIKEREAIGKYSPYEEKWEDEIPASVREMIDENLDVSVDVTLKPKTSKLPSIMSKNELEILSFFEKDTMKEELTGIQIGFCVKGWKNHSMSKWASRLVERGKLSKKKSSDGKVKFFKEL